MLNRFPVFEAWLWWCLYLVCFSRMWAAHTWSRCARPCLFSVPVWWWFGAKLLRLCEMARQSAVQTWCIWNVGGVQYRLFVFSFDVCLRAHGRAARAPVVQALVGSCPRHTLPHAHAYYAARWQGHNGPSTRPATMKVWKTNEQWWARF